MADRTCENCIYNEDGFCDQLGILVEDDDTCINFRSTGRKWQEYMMDKFLKGH